MRRVLAQLTAARKGPARRLGQLVGRCRRLWTELCWAVAPTRCGGCGEAPVAGAGLGLCGPCHATLWPNAGARCPACDAPLPGAGAPYGPASCGCALRALQARLGRRVFVGCRAPWRYAGPLARAIVRGKYEGHPNIFAALGALLATDAEVQFLARGADAIAYVPSTKARVRERGYDAAALLAGALAQKLRLPLRCALQRTDDDPSRSLRSGAWRRLRPPALVASPQHARRVLLVDDVCTTGTSLAAAVEALVSAGAASVGAVVAARRG